MNNIMNTEASQGVIKSPGPIFGLSSLNRMAWCNNQEVANIDKLSNYVMEQWNTLTPLSKVRELNKMKPDARRDFFDALPDDDKVTVLDFIEQRKKERQELSMYYNIALKNIVLMSSVNVISIMGMVDPILSYVIREFRDRGLDNAKIYHGKWKNKYCSVKPLKMLQDKYREAMEFVTHIDSGSVTENLSNDLESKWKQYEFTGSFSMMCQKEYNKAFKCITDKMYLKSLGVAEKHNKRQSKILANLYVAFMLTQIIDTLVSLDDNDARKLTSDVNDTFTKMYEEEGVVWDNSVGCTLLSCKPITDLMCVIQLLIEFVKEAEVTDDELTDCNKLCNEFIASVFDPEERDSLLGDITKECAGMYQDWYFLKMAEDESNNIKHSDECKEEIENVFGNKTGWMRIIKDCKMYNKYIHDKDSSDIYDRLDLLREGVKSGELKLHAYNQYKNNLKEMREGTRPSRYRLNA